MDHRILPSNPRQLPVPLVETLRTRNRNRSNVERVPVYFGFSPVFFSPARQTLEQIRFRAGTSRRTVTRASYFSLDENRAGGRAAGVQDVQSRTDKTWAAAAVRYNLGPPPSSTFAGHRRGALFSRPQARAPRRIRGERARDMLLSIRSEFSIRDPRTKIIEVCVASACLIS